MLHDLFPPGWAVTTFVVISNEAIFEVAVHLLHVIDLLPVQGEAGFKLSTKDL